MTNKINHEAAIQPPVYIENINNNANEKSGGIYNIIKRLADVLISLLALVLLALPILIISVLIKAEDGGSVFYRPVRVGKGGNPFSMIKFRTMKVNAERLENYLDEEELAEYKKEFKVKNDPRLTKIGRILRKCSADEIPQIFNIIRGDMSIVGPRPVLDEETRLYGEKRDYLLSVKPGLTGYWQAYARNNVGYTDGRRQQMELTYVDNRSLWFDIKIIFMTIKRVLTGSGAF